MKKTIFLNLALLLVITVLAPGANRSVPGDYRTIQEAINAASSGDTIIVADGTYTGSGNRDIDFKGKAITVRSENGPENCIIDCQGGGRGFYFHNGENNNSALDGFTVTNGRAWRGAPHRLGYGAGIACKSASPTISNCIIRGNRADNGGGGLCLGDARVSNCIISNNLAEWGGGVWGGTGKIINCVITNNRATVGYGGGICGWQNSSTEIINCVVVNNSARQAGGGIMLRIASATIINSIFWNPGSEVYTDNSSRATVTFSDIEGGYSGEGNIKKDPLLGPDGYHLEAGSPCINAGDPDYSPGPNEIDIDGEPRVMAARVDMGADEFTYDPVTLAGLEIVGPEEVAENSSAQYSAIALYEPDYTADVTTTTIWSLESDEYATINQYGSLTTGRIEPSETITIYAQYTDSGVTVDAEITVQVSPLVDLEITGPQGVRGNCQQQYNLIAYYGNGHTSDVTDSALWLVEPNTLASIEKGLLCTQDIDELQNITIYAQYSSGGVTLEGEMTIQGFPPPPYTFYVPADFQTIQEAIDFAEHCDIIVVSPGTYTGPGNRDIDFLGKPITVRSENGPDNCIIDCQGTKDDQHGGFYFQKDEDMSSILDGFTIINGYAWQGGGIFCHNSNPMITNCIIVSNTAAGQGGGIYCWRSSPTITNCSITGNAANGDCGGGGIFCDYGSNPMITNCTISSNTARGGGGAVYSRDSNPIIINCNVTNNKVGYDGGGIYCDGGSPTITNCTITGNIADGEDSYGRPCGKGGGIRCRYKSNLTITNCTITQNSAAIDGGGIYCYFGSDLIINNCILWDNTAPRGHEISALYAEFHETPYPSTVTVNYGDVEGGFSEAYVESGCTLNWGQGNIDADPCFVELGYWDTNELWVEGDYHLLAGSPCIDAGDNTAVPADITDLDGDGNTTEPIPFDLDGNPRIVDGNDDGIAVVDMGAFEAMVSCFGVNHVKLETKAGKKGNKVELKGTFSPALPIDFAVDDVAYIIDDGQGNALVFLIPAGSFEPEGKPDKQKFKFHSPKHSEPDIKAKFDFDKCKFELKAKRVQGTDEITGTTLTIELWAGANVAQELVEVKIKPRHTEYKREPKLSCCPKCKGIALLEVTSTGPFTGDEYVLLFEPDPGKEKLKRKTVVDDGVNGRVKIDTSCSKPLEVGDVFGVYTVTDLIKIFDDWPDDENDEQASFAILPIHSRKGCKFVACSLF